MRLFASLALALAALPLQAAVDAAKVQRAIDAQGAGWQAGKSWVSELDDAGARRLMGARDEIRQDLDYSDAYAGPTYEAIDWRNKDGVNWLGAVMNQGNCGSCVAFATVATVEAQTSISSGAAWLKPQLSPQALFACGGGSCDRGWMTDPAASHAKNKGLVDNACAPYTMGSDGEDVACRQFCGGQAARTMKVTGYKSPWFNSAAKVKEALKKGPVVTTMMVYEDFLTYKSGVYRNTGGRMVGGHAVSIVGFSDEGRYWIVRNSWGEQWGENGFVRVSWDDRSGVGGSMISFEVAPRAALTVASPAENDYVWGEHAVALAHDRADNYQVKLMKDGREIMALERGNSLDTLALEDGRYELRAVSTSDASVQSQVRGFTVSNHVPEMSLAFRGAAGVDLSRPVKDRLEFEVDAFSSGVPMQKVDFMVTTPDGQFVTSRTTDVVLAKMKLGFRFNNVPNGDYLIFFRGYLPAAGGVHTVDSSKVRVKVQN